MVPLPGISIPFDVGDRKHLQPPAPLKYSFSTYNSYTTKRGFLMTPKSAFQRVLDSAKIKQSSVHIHFHPRRSALRFHRLNLTFIPGIFSLLHDFNQHRGNLNSRSVSSIGLQVSLPEVYSKSKRIYLFPSKITCVYNTSSFPHLIQ